MKITEKIGLFFLGYWACFIFLSNISLDYKFTTGELISATVLIITAVIVWGYTKAAQKSNEISERPILNLYLRESEIGSNTERKFRLRNVGRGPAYNIRLSEIKTGKYRYRPYVEGANPILEKDKDEKTLKFIVKTPKGIEVYDNITGIMFFTRRLFPSSIPEKLHESKKRTSAIFLINYKGINNKNYYSIFRLYPKIYPLLYDDLVVEFIKSDTGNCSKEEAYKICDNKETRRSIFE